MSEVVDEFKQRLEDKTIELQKCQKEKQTDTCLTCNEILECNTRKNYVEAVYNSMSKGQAGGFEF